MKQIKDLSEQPRSSINWATDWSIHHQEGPGTHQGLGENGRNPGQQLQGSCWESVTAPSWNTSPPDLSSEADTK